MVKWFFSFFNNWEDFGLIYFHQNKEILLEKELRMFVLYNGSTGN